MIHPSPPSSPSPILRAPAVWPVYELHASEVLPTIDCSRSLKHVLFHGVWLMRWESFQRRTRQFFRVCFVIGIALVCAAPFLAKQKSQRIAVVVSVLLVVPVLLAYTTMRVDILRLLMRTYDFWYFTVVSIISNLLIALNLGDVRAMQLVYQMLLYQLVVLIDAKTHAIRAAVIGSVVGAVTILTFLALQSFHLVRDYGNVTIATYSLWTLSASDVVLNGLSTIAVMLLRNAYRKHHATSHLDRTCSTTRCVTLRSYLRFVAIDPATPQHDEASTTDTTRLASLPSTSISQLRLASSGLRINAREVVQTFFPLPSTIPPYRQWLWSAIAGVGIVSTVCSLIVDRHPQQRLDLWFAVLGAMSSAAFTWRCFFFHNRRLLRYALSSFDFMFLADQTYIAQVLLCVVLKWDLARCLCVLSSWHWIHWVFTLDMLTPIVVQRLAIARTSTMIAVVVLVIHIVGVAMLSYEILYQRAWSIDDYTLARITIASQHVDIKAVPFLFGRMATLVCWCGRFLWRLVHRSSDGLLMIRGPVEYDDYAIHHTLRAANKRQPKHCGASMLTALAPGPTPSCSVISSRQ